MEQKKINISAIQLWAKPEDKSANFEKVSKLINQINETDIIVLPEVWTIGWDCEIFQNYAEELDSSETIKFLSEMAKTKNSNIIGGSFITKSNGKYYNTCPVINRKGELVCTYNKNHLYSYYGSTEGKHITVGESPVMVYLDGINIGLSVCYDIRFVELYRSYRKAGADLFVNCAAWASSKPIPWEMMTKSRAIENQTFMIAVNQYGQMKNNDTNLGHSRIIDYNGNVLDEILDGEGVIQAELNIEEMKIFRNKTNVLNDIKKSYEVKLCKSC